MSERTLIGDRLISATGGRRYCFMIMHYNADFHLFKAIKALVNETTGLECIRADDILAPGENIGNKVHAAIDTSSFVIADISEPSPNVYYEVGYAVARNKEALLLAKEGLPIPTDLSGIELIRYTTTAEGWPRLQQILRNHLAAQTGLAHVSFLRSMIVPRQPLPSYILASPKPPDRDSRFRYSPYERRTYGDNLGIIGIQRAFGSVYGEHIGPELITAERVDKELLLEDASFYLIGSPKVNKPTEVFLAEMQRPGGPDWRLDPAPGEQPIGDYEVQLSGMPNGPNGRPFTSPVRPSPSDKLTEDFGLIIRGPNPRFPARLVTILAGPHSYGTGAACIAATNSSLIRQIAAKLRNGMLALADHSQTIWVLVSARPDPKDSHIDPDGVSIVASGTYNIADPEKRAAANSPQ
jgi:hypothetical protein